MYEPIRVFNIGDDIYYTGIDLDTNTVALLNIEHVVLLTISHSGVLVVNNDILGMFSLDADHNWKYQSSDNFLISSTHHIDQPEGLIDFEVQVCKSLLMKGLVKQ